MNWLGFLPSLNLFYVNLSVNSSKYSSLKAPISVPHLDVFWEYRFLKVSVWMVLRYPKLSNCGHWKSKNIRYSMSSGKHISFVLKRYISKVFIGSLFHKVLRWICMEKCQKTFYRPVLKQYKNMTGCVWSIFSEKQIKYEYLKYFKKYTKSLGDT